MKLGLLYIVMFSALPVSNGLEQARYSFPDIARNEQKLERLQNELHSKRDVISKAYYGAFVMMSAEHTSYPLRKYNRFQKGKTILESCIRQKPQLAELRYIRFMIQSNVPSFLGYSSQLEEDLDLILKHKKQLSADAKLYQRVKSNLKKIDNLPAQLQSKIEKL